jgi:hypothetical protein
MNEEFKILSIDAWGNQDDGYEWNNWHKVGSWSSIPKTDKGILKKMIADGYLTQKALTGCVVEDDQYNYVICDKKTGEPLFAIEYGSHY